MIAFKILAWGLTSGLLLASAVILAATGNYLVAGALTAATAYVLARRFA